PHSWIAYMKDAIRTCAPAFSMRRMVKEYTQRFYVPEILYSKEIEKNNYAQARALASWKEKVRLAWPRLQLFVEGRREGQLSLGESINVRAWVRSDVLQPGDFTVELVFGEAGNENIDIQGAVPMEYIKKELDGSYSYQISLQPPTSGSIVYGVRVLPNHQHLVGKHAMGLIRWG
ncbi:MAG TPA: alpha-glucan phosphorylase, partial [Ktedonobacteraceae bacterium]|nr:alpha-glucan phosphorylase [Ktedonobacteraceae bacterium]